MENKFKYKSDSQLIMLALGVIMHKSEKHCLEHSELINELITRGCEVHKASKFVPDEEIKTSDNIKADIRGLTLTCVFQNCKWNKKTICKNFERFKQNIRFGLDCQPELRDEEIKICDHVWVEKSSSTSLGTLVKGLEYYECAKCKQIQKSYPI